jgi:hypothetical protein
MQCHASDDYRAPSQALCQALRPVKRRLCLRRLLLAGLLLAQPLPAHATEAPLSGLMHVTEISPSGAAFQFWAPSDVVGLHSRLKVEVAVKPPDLRKRVGAMEAGVEDDDEAVAGTLTLLGLSEDLMIASLDRPTQTRAFTALIGRLRAALAKRAERKAVYRLVVRARLQHSTSGGLLPRPKAAETEEPFDLTPEDAPAAFTVERTGGGLSLSTRAAWASVGPNGRLAEPVRRLDEAAKHKPGLEHASAVAHELLNELQALQPLIALAEQPPSSTIVQGYIPEQAELDLDTLPARRAGDHVELQLVLTRDGDDMAVLEERTAVLHKVGLYPDAKLGVTFTSLGQWSPALTLVAKWGYRTGFTASNKEMFGPLMRLRGMMSGGALMWNEVWDPGIALNLSGQGVGVGLSFFKELLQVGRGYNPATGDFYWYGGLGLPVSLFDVVQQ